jgi:hypothetical protein
VGSEEEIEKALKAIKDIADPSPSPFDRNYLTEEEINQLLKAIGCEGETHYPPPEVSYSRHRDHKRLTYAEFWKDWSSWLATCKWEHVRVLVSCRDALERILRDRTGVNVQEDKGTAFAATDFSNTRPGTTEFSSGRIEKNADILKFHVIDICQRVYRAYSTGEGLAKLDETICWAADDTHSEDNFAYMALATISRAFYEGTENENNFL